MRRPPQLGQNLGPCRRAAPDARARSLAAEARKPRVEDATQLEVRELALDELRQSGFLARLGRGTQEGVEVGGDDPMEPGVPGVLAGPYTRSAHAIPLDSVPGAPRQCPEMDKAARPARHGSVAPVTAPLWGSFARGCPARASCGVEANSRCSRDRRPRAR